MKKTSLKIIPFILSALISIPLSAIAVPTQFEPAAKIELEKYELSREEMNTDVKLHIIAICLSPVIFLLSWYFLIKIKSLIFRNKK
jgi:hypothetical protein